MIALCIPLIISFIFFYYLNKSYWAEISYFFVFIVFTFFKLIPVGLGIKIVGYNMGFDNLSLRLTILSLWVSILIIYSRTLIFLNKNSDTIFTRIIVILLLSLLVRFFSTNLFIFYFFFEFSLIPTLILIIG